MPTFNGIGHLQEAIDSIFLQEPLPRELIVVDDCSTDGTPQLVKRLASHAPIPVRLLQRRANSGGPSRPLNTGIREATGSIIAILEQDDLMSPSRLRQQVAALGRHPAATVAIGRYELLPVSPDLQLPWSFSVPQFHGLELSGVAAGDDFEVPAPKAFAALLAHNFSISNSNFCFRKDLWQRIGGFDERVRAVSDLDFVLRALLHGPLVVVNSVTLRYRLRSGSLNRADRAGVKFETTLVRLRAIQKCPAWSESFLSSHPSLTREFLRHCLSLQQYMMFGLLLKTHLAVARMRAVTGASKLWARSSRLLKREHGAA